LFRTAPPERLRYHGGVIVDIHTHVFPQDVRDNREDYLERDAGFRELYSKPEAKIATVEELLTSMDEAGVDVSVICGFGWSDPELCREHSDALLEAAAASGGRLVAFCPVQPLAKEARDELKRVASKGARGLGELRPAQQGYGLVDSDEADLLAWAAEAYDLAVLFHTSEPVGHPYAGKEGLPVVDLARFVSDFRNVSVIGAHWGGGLPFYALMPEVRETLAHTYFDTAASHLLYSPEVYQRAIELAGAEHIVFGSDFPLTTQQRALERLREAVVDEDARRLIEGENAQKLLRL
jgi:predicted TIM-barrel fold metal-dependent hydrolase